MPRLTIDGRTVDAACGSTVLDAAAQAGVFIPTLCADPRLTPSGACRLCVVHVDRQHHPVAACTTPVVDGMTVTTRTPDLSDHRRQLLTMLARRYPADVTSAANEPFHALLAAHGLSGGESGTDDTTVDDSHPLIRADWSRCISCWRCVRICEEVQGQDVWRIEGRGTGTHIVPDAPTFGESSCVSCGACVDTCPTGALESRDVLAAPGPALSWTRTTCAYCGVGCELLVGTRDGTIVEVVPAIDAPANRGHACVKGRFAHGFVNAADRVTSPMIRDGDDWIEVSWDEAIERAASELRNVIARHGRDAVGVLGSARATNESNYAIQKFARAAIGTNNVDGCARVCHAPSAAGLKQMLGTGAATSSYDDIDQAATILVCGANVTENHPVVGARIKQAVRGGARLIVIDPRRIELAEIADVHLQLHPGTTVELLNSIAAVIVSDGLIDGDFVARRVDGLDEFERLVTRYQPDVVAGSCGVAAADIRTAARLYAGGGPAIAFHGLGITEHVQGTETVMALVNLALMTGNVGRPGTGVNPLRGQNNVQGSAHMGCEPGHLPGYIPLASGSRRVAEVWGADVPETRGLDAMEMIDAAGGSVHALYVVGWDVHSTNPNTNVTAASLSALESVIVQDLFLNETARHVGTVFLPAAASAFESEGTFMSSERRVQRVRTAVPPPGAALPDWEIVGRLAAALGRGDLFPFRSAAEIWEEIRLVWPAGAGITAAALDQPGGRQWPCPAPDHPGSVRLHGDRFATPDGRARLRCVGYRPPADPRTDSFPLVLVTGRTLGAFNSGTMTSRSAVAVLHPTDLLEVNPADAGPLGLADGDRARVASRFGDAVLPVKVTSRAAAGELFTTFHDPAAGVNRLTGPHRDEVTNTPAYKHTAVRLERVNG